jgi:HAD superfamily hydrolase (TIGR01509 family)
MGLIKAIAFDVDGTLVDSDQTHFDAFNAVLSRHNLPAIDWGTYVSKGLISYDDTRFFSEITGWQGLREIYLEGLVKEKESEMKTRMETNPPKIYPYVAGLVQCLGQRKIPMFLATGSEREEVQQYFRGHPRLMRHLSIMATASDKLPSKPDPALFNKGLERLNAALQRNISPDEVVGIEDTAKGILALRNAGMHAIGVLNTTDNAQTLYAGGACAVVSTISRSFISRVLGVQDQAGMQPKALQQELRRLKCFVPQVA